MENRNTTAWILGAIATVSGLFSIFDYATQFGLWLSANFGNFIVIDFRFIFYVVGILLFPVYLIISYFRKPDMKYNRHLLHLRIHYSQKNDTPKTKSPAKPYYVVYWDAKQAYWVPDLISSQIKKGKIQYNSHDGLNALQKHFKNNGITTNKRNPTLTELGLELDKNGNLLRLIPEPDIITKLKGRRLSDVELVCLFPWHYHFRNRDNFPNKILLRKYSTNVTFHAPTVFSKLIEYGIVSRDNCIIYPWENLKRWSKRKGYTYYPQRFSDEQLLAELQNSKAKGTS